MSDRQTRIRRKARRRLSRLQAMVAAMSTPDYSFSLEVVDYGHWLVMCIDTEHARAAVRLKARSRSIRRRLQARTLEMARRHLVCCIAPTPAMAGAR